MFVRLHQKTKDAKWEMHEFQKYAYMKYLWLCSILMAPAKYGLSPWLNTFLMFKNTKEVLWSFAPSLPTSHLL